MRLSVLVPQMRLVPARFPDAVPSEACSERQRYEAQARRHLAVTTMRVMRAPSGVLYGPEFEFEFGKGYVVRDNPADTAVIISSSRGVHEALAVSKQIAVAASRSMQT